jgi:hypothetical protein
VHEPNLALLDAEQMTVGPLPERTPPSGRLHGVPNGTATLSVEKRSSQAFAAAMSVSRVSIASREIALQSSAREYVG